MRRQNVYRLAAMLPALFLAVAVAAGCGGGKSEDAPAEPGGQAPVVEAPEAPTVPQVEVKGDATAGKAAYTAYCSSCHGPGGEGITGLGKSLVASEFVAEKSDAELLVYVKEGRGVDDPLNTTGIPMPPKGGNPALTDQEIADIIAYIRTIHAS